MWFISELLIGKNEKMLYFCEYYEVDIQPLQG